MENPRTTSTRDHDDSALIDAAEPGTAQAGGAGGTLAADVATQDELDRVADPEAHSRVKKADAIEHGEEQRPNRARAANASGD